LRYGQTLLCATASALFIQRFALRQRCLRDLLDRLEVGGVTGLGVTELSAMGGADYRGEGRGNRMCRTNGEEPSPHPLVSQATLTT
jgi:hypothetical protein